MLRSVLTESKLRTSKKRTTRAGVRLEPLEERRMLDAGGSIATAQFITSGNLTADLSSHGDLDFYAFFAKAGNTITAIAAPTNLSAKRSAQLDPIVAIYNSAGTRVAIDDDSGGSSGNPWRAVASAPVTNDGIWYVAVTDYPDFQVDGSADNGPGANTGRYSLSIDGISGITLNNVSATFDRPGNGTTFGTYLPYTPLTNSFTVDVGIELPSTFELRYRFGSKAPKVALRSGTTFRFDAAMQDINPSDSELKLELYYKPQNVLVSKYSAPVEFYDQISVDLKLKYDHSGPALALSEVRLLEGFNETWIVEATPVSAIDFFDSYANGAVTLNLARPGDSGQKFSLAKSGNKFTGNLPRLVNQSDGVDYRLSLTGLSAPEGELLTAEQGLVVNKLPDWMKDIGIEARTFNDGVYEINLRSKRFSGNTDAINDTLYGLLNGRQSSVAIDLQLLANAPVLVAETPTVVLEDASINAQLLGESIIDSQFADSIKVEASLNAMTLALAGGLRVFSEGDVTLAQQFAPRFGGSLKLPDAIVAAASTAGLSFNAGVSLAVTPGPVKLEFDVGIDLVDSKYRLRDGSFVVVATSATGNAGIQASAGFLTFGKDALLKIIADGGINFAAGLRAQFSLTGPLGSPSVEVDKSQSGLAANVRWALQIRGEAGSDTFEKKYSATFLELSSKEGPESKPYRLWGDYKSVFVPNVDLPTFPNAGNGLMSESNLLVSLAQADGSVAVSLATPGEHALRFGPDTTGRDLGRIIVTNDGEDAVLIERTSIVGNGFELVQPFGRPVLFLPGESLEIEVRLLNPDLPAQGTLRLETDSNTLAIVDVALEYDVASPVDAILPTVESIALRSSSWTDEIPSVLIADDVISTAGLDQVAVTFSEPVDVFESDLFLRGGILGEVSVGGFAVEDRVAIWTLAAPLGKDRFALDVSPHIRDRVGNSLATAATSRFVILPGDADGSGEIGFADFVLISNNFGKPSVGLEEIDFDGNGVIGFGDFVVMSNGMGSSSATLPLPDLYPELGEVQDQWVMPGQTLTLQLSAHDENIQDQLEFLLLDSPVNATLDPLAGHLTIAVPTDLIADEFPVVVAVRDDSAGSLTNSRAITFRVQAPNVAPILNPIAPHEVRQGELLMVQAVATDDNTPLDELIFSLDSAPHGATIESTNGMINWLPGYNLLPGATTFVVRVTDRAGESNVESFQVDLVETNQSPRFAEIAPQNANELQELTIAVVAEDQNSWNILDYRLGLDAPAGATIDSATGQFRWTPGEADDGTHFVTVIVTDDRSPSLSDEITLTIQVNEAENPTILAAIGDQQALEDQELNFTAVASDLDAPATIVYTLENAPPGATIDESTGYFSWTPPLGSAGQYTFTIRASGGGTDEFDARATVTVQVQEQLPTSEILLFDPEDRPGAVRTVQYSGYIESGRAIVGFRGGLNSMSPDDFVDLYSLLDDDLNFLIEIDTLNTILGSTLSDGTYTLRLVAEDIDGNTFSVDREFTLDTIPPTITVSLHPEFDSGVIGDFRTRFDSATLMGTADPGTDVFVNGAIFTADASGTFVVPHIPLPQLGRNVTWLYASDAARNSSELELTIIRETETNLFGPDLFGYQVSAVPSTFVDISTTGRALLSGADNVSVWITAAELAGFQFPFYGQTYSEVFVSSNGLISFGEHVQYFSWEESPFLATSVPLIAPLWDDLIVSGFADSSVYVEVVGTPGAQQLIVQWNSVQSSSEISRATFQVVLDATDGSIQFNYLDILNAEGFADFSSLAGIKGPGPQRQLEASLLIAHRSGPNEFVGGNLSTKFTLASPDVHPPVVQVSLLDDTGSDSQDKITNNPALAGYIFDANTIASLKAGFNSASPDQYVDLLVNLQANGVLSLGRDQLEEIFGGQLPDGVHVLHLVAADTFGNQHQTEVSFDLDTVAPTGTAELAPESDTGTIGDGYTSLSDVTIVGQADPGSTIVLALKNGSYQVEADESGQYSITDLWLPHLGLHNIEVSIFDIAGNSTDFTLPIYLVTPNGTLGPDDFGYTASVVAPEFIDIRTTGTSILAGADDDFVELLASDLSGFEFSFYGRTYDSFFVASNGMLTFGEGNSVYYDSAPATIYALATDLFVPNAPDSGVYYQVFGAPGSQQLIVQWNNVGFQNSDGLVTFQLVLDAATNTVQLNYLDLDTDDDYTNGGASATVGIKAAEYQGQMLAGLIVADDFAPNEFVGTGLSTRFSYLPDLFGPVIVADTADGEFYTSDPAISGQVFDAGNVVAFTGGFGDQTVDLFPDLVDGEFYLDATRLSELYGGTFPIGEFELRLTATDDIGNSNSVSVSFYVIPLPPEVTFEIAQEYDSGPKGDLVTSFHFITIIGYTEPGTYVFFESDWYLADETGTFQVPNVRLWSYGENYFYVFVENYVGQAVYLDLMITRVFVGEDEISLSLFTDIDSNDLATDLEIEGNRSYGSIGDGAYFESSDSDIPGRPQIAEPTDSESKEPDYLDPFHLIAQPTVKMSAPDSAQSQFLALEQSFGDSLSSAVRDSLMLGVSLGTYPTDAEVEQQYGSFRETKDSAASARGFKQASDEHYLTAKEVDTLFDDWGLLDDWDDPLNAAAILDAEISDLPDSVCSDLDLDLIGA